MHDIVIRGGTIYDGSGSAPFVGDIGIDGQAIAAIGAPGTLSGQQVINADGLAVAPGFINMLSWAVESLIEDGRSQGNLRQGVTLEVLGEGFSMGPLSDAMKAAGTRGILGNNDIQYEVDWTTLGEYLESLVRRGVSTNVASFVGTSTLRIHALGYEDRPPTPAELEDMQELAAQAMREGAVGLSSALIYPPAAYASTDELIALAKVVSQYGGLYISHLRSEGDHFLEALEELITISREANIRAEIYHLKAAGRKNWGKMAQVIERVEQARRDGMEITADMYLYPAGGTGLNAIIPPWAHDGGDAALLARLRDPETRARVKQGILEDLSWENMYLEADGPDKILLAGFTTEALKPLTGKTLAEVAALRGTDPIETAFDLLIEDGGRIFTMYFTMSEDNIRRQVQLPWVSFCSDAESMSPEGVFLKSNPHPRAYGNFARLLGHYVRDEGLVPLPEAIRRLTSFPASVLRLQKRGSLQVGNFADIAIFDAATVRDHATFAAPHQFAEGMVHVLVNGTPVIRDGEHTDAKPGQVVRGPGWMKD
ncbi:MAG: D-aminoacylase [Chloroflexi bacterium]|uniref:N-acyl-D-amino-acid deacylase family protein n=1 Tax=Candidatus Flexifilum breve TaxID=3140694 RepID=UPI0031365220|nr:D-aminoacylase [Chloroflexota bacterium]